MTAYVRCIRSKRGMNAPDCRELSKAYLQCRMDRNLMAPDEMKNLGFANKSDGEEKANAGSGNAKSN